MIMTWPEVFIDPDSVTYFPMKGRCIDAEADLLVGKGNLLSGNYPPEKYGEGCVKIVKAIGVKRHLELMPPLMKKKEEEIPEPCAVMKTDSNTNFEKLKNFIAEVIKRFNDRMKFVLETTREKLGED